MILSIIIVNYKTSALTKLCVSSIKNSLKNNDYEIIVLDVASNEEESEEIHDKFPDIKLIPIKENVGYSKSVNLGIKNSNPDSKYLLILNADIVVINGAISALIKFLDSNSNVGMAGPQLLNFNNTIQYSCFRFYTPAVVLYRRLPFVGKIKFVQKTLNDFLMKEWDHKTMRSVDWLMGSALMIRREALDATGLMDERFFMYFEDVDWCRRFWENEWRVVYYPLAKMAHYHGKQSSGFGKYTIIHIISAFKYFNKFMGKNIPHKE